MAVLCMIMAATGPVLGCSCVYPYAACVICMMLISKAGLASCVESGGTRGVPSPLGRDTRICCSGTTWAQKHTFNILPSLVGDLVSMLITRCQVAGSNPGMGISFSTLICLGHGWQAHFGLQVINISTWSRRAVRMVLTSLRDTI